MFGHINNKAKSADIEFPEEYIQVIQEAGSAVEYMTQEEFINFVPILRGLFTFRKTDVGNVRLDNITTYAWYRFTKTDAGEVVMMLKKTTVSNDPWIIVAIEKRRGQQHNQLSDCPRPYCDEYDDGTFEGKKREIKLDKAWDLYDLAQDFLSDKAKGYYTQPNEPRPTNNITQVLDDDSIHESDDDSDDDMHNLFEE